MLNLGCLALLGVVCLRRAVSYIYIGLSRAHGAKYDSALLQAFLVVLSIGQIIGLHFRWPGIQACDTLSALYVGHVQYVDLLTAVFGAA